MKINIKGKDYEIQIRESLDGNLGETNVKQKIIRLLEYYSDEEEIKQTIAHELTHAFFYECGLEKYCDDEILVEWIDKHIYEITSLTESIYRNYVKTKRNKRR